MDTTINDAAVEAACAVIYSGYVGGKRDYRRECEKETRSALEAAMPHLQPAKPEAVRLRDELRERAEFEAWAGSAAFDTYFYEGMPGWYKSVETHSAWRAWQAALAATGKQQVGDGIAETLAGVKAKLNPMEWSILMAGLSDARADEWVAPDPIGYRWRHSANEPWQYSSVPCGWEHEPVYAARQPVAEAWIVVKEHVWDHGDGGRPTLAYLWPYEFERRIYPSFAAASAFIKEGKWPLGFVAMQIQAPPAQAVDLGQFREAVNQWKLSAERVIRCKGHAMAEEKVKVRDEAVRLLTLIDGQA